MEQISLFISWVIFEYTKNTLHPLMCKIATLTGEGGERGGGLYVYVCAFICVYTKLPHYLFVFEFCNLKLDFRIQKQSRIWKKICLDKTAHFFSCDQCHQRDVRCLCIPGHSEGCWAGQSVLRGPPHLLNCPEVGSSLKGLAVCNSVKNSITRIGMTAKNRSLFPILLEYILKVSN